jgi:hypothetical protein
MLEIVHTVLCLLSTFCSYHKERVISAISYQASYHTFEKFQSILLKSINPSGESSLDSFMSSLGYRMIYWRSIAEIKLFRSDW